MSQIRENISAQGSRVLFYSSVKCKDLFYIQKFYQIDIELLTNLGYDIILSNRIFDFICFWKYDIAFIYFYKYGLFAAILSKLFSKKVYFTGGIDNLDESSVNQRDYFLQKYFYKACYLFSDTCILVSSMDENNVRKIFDGILPQRTTLSYHTIDVERFLMDELVSKDNIFSTIAWMETVDNVIRKGIPKSLIVFKYLSEKIEFKDSKYFIIGKEGEGSDYLKKLCFDLDIIEKVIFTGAIAEEDKVQILKKSKFYFQLSVYEGFGIAALEALTANNIVIHSGKGGLSDTIKDYGIIVEIERDMMEQIDSIYDKMKNYNKKKFISSRKYILENYSNIRRQNDFKKILKN